MISPFLQGTPTVAGNHPNHPIWCNREKVRNKVIIRIIVAQGAIFMKQNMCEIWADLGNTFFFFIKSYIFFSFFWFKQAKYTQSQLLLYWRYLPARLLCNDFGKKSYYLLFFSLHPLLFKSVSEKIGLYQSNLIRKGLIINTDPKALRRSFYAKGSKKYGLQKKRDTLWVDILSKNISLLK